MAFHGIVQILIPKKEKEKAMGHVDRPYISCKHSNVLSEMAKCCVPAPKLNSAQKVGPFSLDAHTVSWHGIPAMVQRQDGVPVHPGSGMPGARAMNGLDGLGHISWVFGL